jgi:hypothetical protein
VSSSRYDLVRVTLHGITHAARRFVHWGTWEVIEASCGTPVGPGEIHGLNATAPRAPDVDCMSCLVAEGKPHAR